MKRRPLWWRRLIASLAPRRSLKIAEGDMLPEKLPLWNLVVARDGNEDWSVGLRCPCGCGQRLDVSLHPSVWLREGCKSHFWLRSGKIVWCD
jgi:Family of unknown function (DUF6527)